MILLIFFYLDMMMFRRVFHEKSNIFAINFARNSFQINEPICTVKSKNKLLLINKNYEHNLKNPYPKKDFKPQPDLVQDVFKLPVSSKSRRLKKSYF